MTSIKKAILESLPPLVLTEVATLVSVYLLGIIGLSMYRLSSCVLVLFIISLSSLATILVSFDTISTARFLGVSVASLWIYQLFAWFVTTVELTSADFKILITDTFYLTVILCCIDGLMLILAVENYRRRIREFFEGLLDLVWH